MMTEQQVLRKLKISDFGHLTKDNVIQMTSMLDEMDPEVAKKALEQFPEFTKTTREILKDYKDSLDKGLQSNNDSVKNCYATYNSIIISLQKELEKDKLSIEDKKYIFEQMKYVADKVDKKDTENKKFIAGMSMLTTAVVTGALGLLISAIGGNVKIGPGDGKNIYR